MGLLQGTKRQKTSQIECLLISFFKRPATEDEVAVFKKIGSIASHRCGPLLHEDDIMFLIESCESFPVFLDTSLEESPEKQREKIIPSEFTRKQGRAPKNKLKEQVKESQESQNLPDNPKIDTASEKRTLKEGTKESKALDMTNLKAESPKVKKRKVGRPRIVRENPPNDTKSVKIPKRTSRTPVKNYQESDELLLEVESTSEIALEDKMSPEVKKRGRKSKKQSQEQQSSNAASSENENSFQKRDLDLSSLSELPTSEPAASLLSPSSAFSKSEITSNQNDISPSTSSRKPRIKSIRSAIMRPPNLTISDLGRIEFSEEMLKAAKLWKSPKKLLREQLEVERLARKAKRTKERELKQAEKKAKKTEKSKVQDVKKESKKSPARPDRLRQSIKAPEKSLPYEKLAENRPRIKKSANGKITKDRSITKKRKSLNKVSEVPNMPPPPEPDLQPAQILGCVTFKSGDNIIRRSPRKLPEAAKTAVNQQTGVIPYAFAALLGNTHGVIPAGLSEKHFLSYRPAMKRASNHWLEEIDSGLDSTDELAALQVLLNQSQKEAKRSRENIQHKPERTKTESNESENMKGSEGGSTSGDSGRETPTTADLKPFSLQKLKLESTSTAEILNEIDVRNYSLSSFCLGRNNRPRISS
ncbi:unnamed protein product [Oikopleura dioica]|uniref:Uncharacterized protein n=1 Tax=Oikopleura dioica TaxID=34765 RepID=E4YPE3_OIKDI|nr:unnamed protein product [Oikopleura dioica]